MCNLFLQRSQLGQIWDLCGKWLIHHAGQSRTDSSSSCPTKTHREIQVHQTCAMHPIRRKGNIFTLSKLKAKVWVAIYRSHLIFLPWSVTLVLLMIPAFSSRWPCRVTNPQVNSQTGESSGFCRLAVKFDSSENMGVVIQCLSEGFSLRCSLLLLSCGSFHSPASIPCLLLTG